MTVELGEGIVAGVDFKLDQYAGIGVGSRKTKVSGCCRARYRRMARRTKVTGFYVSSERTKIEGRVCNRGLLRPRNKNSVLYIFFIWSRRPQR